MRIEKRHKSLMSVIMEIISTIFLIVMMTYNPKITEILIAITLVWIYWELKRI